MMKHTGIMHRGLHRTSVLLGVLLAGTPLLGHGDSLNQLGDLSQEEFIQLSENVAAAVHYKSIAPPEPLGSLGFDIAIEVSSTDLDSVLFDKASSGGFSTDTFLVPRVHVHKGLPWGLDIGASLTSVPDTDFQVIGAELRYAILKGSIVTPAIGIRGTYSSVTEVNELDLENLGVELAISKGFANFTPYGGVGIIRTESSRNVGAPLSETFNQNKVFAGINVNLGLVNFGFEGDVTGEYTSYSAKFGLRF